VTPHGQLAARLADISDRLLSSASEPVTYQRVVEGAVDLVPGCTGSGITMRQRRGRVATVAATSAAVQRVDELQYALREGPCLDATFEHGPVVVSDLARETRWPQWRPEAEQQGFCSVLSVRLQAGEEEIGALNLYGAEAAAFDQDAIDLGVIYATHAARALDQARVVSGLHAALESRHEIGIAQGVLAVRFDISYDQAFAVLRRYSNDRNLKLREVARQVMAERTLPGAVG
jgi:GAF domain-containing protein